MSFEPLAAVSRNICIIVALLIFIISYTVCLTIYVKHKVVIIKVIDSKEPTDAEVTRVTTPSCVRHCYVLSRAYSRGAARGRIARRSTHICLTSHRESTRTNGEIEQLN